MSDLTPLEQAETFIREADDGTFVWVAKTWDADGNPVYLTYGTVKALVAQIRLDEQRITRLVARIKELTRP